MRQTENKGGRARLNEDELDRGKADQRQNPLRSCNRHKCERPPETAKEQKQVGQLEPQP